MHRALGWIGASAAVCACSSDIPAGEKFSSTNEAVISDAVHGQGSAGFYFLPPMVPSIPSSLAASAPPSSLVGPWVVIDRVALSPAGCTTACIATILTPNVTTITPTGTSDGTGIPIRKGDARNRVQYHLNHAAVNTDDAEPDDDLDDVPDGYWAAHWDSDDFGTVIHGFYRAHIYTSVSGAALELGFADIEVVPDSVSKAAYRKIDRSLYAPLKYGHSLAIDFQIQPRALVAAPPKVLATGLRFPHIAIDPTSVYWTDTYTGTVQKTPLAGGPVTTLASGLQFPNSIALSGSDVYFTTFTGSALEDTVQSVSVSGGPARLIAAGLPNVYGVAVDATGVYWPQGNNLAGSIQKAPLAGGPIALLASSADGVKSPSTVSVSGNAVYWSDTSNLSILSTLTAGGTPVTTTVTTDNWTSALITDSRNVYWTQPDAMVPGGWLLRASPLSGGARITLVASPSLDYRAGAFATDGVNVYYSMLSGTVDLGSATAYTIVRMPVGGGTPVTIASMAQGANVYPASIVVDASSVYWSVGEGEGGQIFTAKIFSAPK